VEDEDTKFLALVDVSLEVNEDELVTVFVGSPREIKPYPASEIHIFSMNVYLKFVRNLLNTLSTVYIVDKMNSF